MSGRGGGVASGSNSNKKHARPDGAVADDDARAAKAPKAHAGAAAVGSGSATGSPASASTATMAAAAGENMPRSGKEEKKMPTDHRNPAPKILGPERKAERDAFVIMMKQAKDDGQKAKLAQREAQKYGRQGAGTGRQRAGGAGLSSWLLWDDVLCTPPNNHSGHFATIVSCLSTRELSILRGTNIALRDSIPHSDTIAEYNRRRRSEWNDWFDSAFAQSGSGGPTIALNAAVIDYNSATGVARFRLQPRDLATMSKLQRYRNLQLARAPRIISESKEGPALLVTFGQRHRTELAKTGGLLVYREAEEEMTADDWKYWREQKAAGEQPFQIRKNDDGVWMRIDTFGRTVALVPRVSFNVVLFVSVDKVLYFAQIIP